MIEYLLIVDFVQKILVEKIFSPTKNFQKEDLIKKSQENCKEESSRYTENLQSQKQTIFSIKDKFGNFFIAITDNSTGKSGFVFDLLLQLEDVLNNNDLEISKETNNFKNDCIKIVEDYNKKQKVEVLHDISSSVSNLNNSKKNNVLDAMDRDLENPNAVGLIEDNEIREADVLNVKYIGAIGIITCIIVISAIYFQREVSDYY